MPRLLIISFVEWHGAVQRPQHMARELTALGWDVTYLNPQYLHRRNPAGCAGNDTNRVRVLQPACLPGERKLAIIGKINNGLVRRAAKPDVPWDAVIFNDPRRASVARSFHATVRIYDAMDDLRALMPSDESARAAEAEAIATADKVWTGTAIMAERLSDRDKSVKFIPNGVDAERFANPDASQVEKARNELGKLFGNGHDGAPIGGFFGVLNERLDPTLIRALLDEGWRVVLIGPSTSQCPDLPAHPKLRKLGWRAYEELPAWLACFDLALIPYKSDGANRFLYPVKALEYLAGGKPVLSSALPDVERFLKDFVLIEAAPEGWRRVAREWKSLGEEAARRAKAGQEFSHQRDWPTMAREMNTELTH